MVVLGGMGSINGSILAAALITFINVKLQTVLTGNLSVLQKVIYALILIGIVIYRNAPGLKGFREKYNLTTLSAKLFKKKQEEESEEVDAQ
jgi:ABC-type branched-subunit amino acid transport system permease subunit